MRVLSLSTLSACFLDWGCLFPLHLGVSFQVSWGCSRSWWVYVLFMRFWACVFSRHSFRGELCGCSALYSQAILAQLLCLCPCSVPFSFFLDFLMEHIWRILCVFVFPFGACSVLRFAFSSACLVLDFGTCFVLNLGAFSYLILVHVFVLNFLVHVWCLVLDFGAWLMLCSSACRSLSCHSPFVFRVWGCD